jgi:hypothetical protein
MRFTYGSVWILRWTGRPVSVQEIRDDRPSGPERRDHAVNEIKHVVDLGQNALGEPWLVERPEPGDAAVRVIHFTSRSAASLAARAQ